MKQDVAVQWTYNAWILELRYCHLQLVGNVFDIRKELEPFVRVEKTREKYNHVEVNLYVEIA